MIRCPDCKAESYLGALFCGGCGGPLVAAARDHVSAAKPTDAPARPDAGRRAVAKISLARPDTPANPPDTERPTRRLSLDSLRPGAAIRRLQFTIGDRSMAYELQPGDEIVIGRGDIDGARPEIDLEPFDGFELGVSRRHAAIRNVSQGLVLIDRNSSNGTWLGGRRLAAGYGYLLNDRAAARFGDLLVNLAIDD